jgi:DNA-binding SARP family transcriptional activator/tetratricopeptide (TPR) repeat protein
MAQTWRGPAAGGRGYHEHVVAVVHAAPPGRDGQEGHTWLRLLGPVEIVDGGSGLRPRGPQLRLLLALLALSAGQVVPVGDLVDALWDDRPPRSARASVQILLTRLRKTLAGVPECTIERYGDGYRMQIGPGLAGVDVYRFRSLVRSVRQYPGDEDAIAVLGQALTLWRGPALADVPGTARVEAIRSGLAEEHLSALEERFGRLLAAGRDAEAAADIPLMLAMHPLAERLAGMLMIAWYRCGRRADALQVFRDLRARLADELGVEPGVELQRLHQRILSGDAAMTVLDGFLRPARALESPLANGTADPAGVKVPVLPRQLPPALARFTGRRQELKSLTGRLDGETGEGPLIIAISGPPGVGKTALALQWAHQVRQRFPDGQLYVNLRGFDASPAPVNPAEAISGILESLGVGTSRIAPWLDVLAGLYRSVLADKRMLIVLDNARDEAQVRPLLPGSPACVVLITSRSEFSGLVAAQGAHPLVLDVPTVTEARRLLADRLGAGRVAAEAGAVTELISLCGRLPLALAIAAARAATRPALPLASIAQGPAGVRHRLDSLDTGGDAGDIRAVFSWSYRLLSERAARMFRLLGAHPGPDIPVAAAASLAAVSVPAARAALAELVGASLAQEQAIGRFTLHDLLRVYAAELGDEDERRAALRRVLDYYLHTAHAAVGLVYPADRPIAITPSAAGAAPERLDNPAGALAWLQAEYQALQAATAAAVHSGFDAHAWQLPAVLSEHLARRGHYLEWARLQQTALAAATRIDDVAAQASALHSLGDALIHLGSWPDARRHLANAMRLYLKLGDPAGQAGCHRSTARLFEAQGDATRALFHARRALRIYRTAGDRTGQAAALNGVGWYYAVLGNNQRALSYCGRALELYRVAGNRSGEGATLDSLGYCHQQSGQHGQAEAFYQQALGAYADLSDRSCRAHTLIHLAETHQATGDQATARSLWRQALAILDELHHDDADAVRAKLREADRRDLSQAGQGVPLCPIAGSKPLGPRASSRSGCR